MKPIETEVFRLLSKNMRVTYSQLLELIGHPEKLSRILSKYEKEITKHKDGGYCLTQEGLKFCNEMFKVTIISKSPYVVNRYNITPTTVVASTVLGNVPLDTIVKRNTPLPRRVPSISILVEKSDSDKALIYISRIAKNSSCITSN